MEQDALAFIGICYIDAPGTRTGIGSTSLPTADRSSTDTGCSTDANSSRKISKVWNDFEKVTNIVIDKTVRYGALRKYCKKTDMAWPSRLPHGSWLGRQSIMAGRPDSTQRQPMTGLSRPYWVVPSACSCQIERAAHLDIYRL